MFTLEKLITFFRISSKIFEKLFILPDLYTRFTGDSFQAWRIIPDGKLKLTILQKNGMIFMIPSGEQYTEVNENNVLSVSVLGK